jgi:hypothetical protein
MSCSSTRAPKLPNRRGRTRRCTALAKKLHAGERPRRYPDRVEIQPSTYFEPRQVISAPGHESGRAEAV